MLLQLFLFSYASISEKNVKHVLAAHSDDIENIVKKLNKNKLASGGIFLSRMTYDALPS